MKIGELRKKYPEFIYKGYAYELKNNSLQIAFDFEVGEITFEPKVVIKNVSNKEIDRVGESALDNLVFHLGLIEMISYWKATASPHIVIEAGNLNKAQINWWHDLFMQGMGQYFYENKIHFTDKNFLTIESTKKSGAALSRGGGVVFTKKLLKRTLVPIGGGKDAVVTLELLKNTKQELRGFVLNPKREHRDILKTAGERNSVIAQRTIDPKLLELNRKGYLNGHTPFSAYLAFLTTLCAALFDFKYIALSNERSSNEGNVDYLGKEINHQYSKSWDFEKKFYAYSKKYLAKNIEYFSFLRPLYELQIAKLFAQYPRYFATFLSCNEAHKTDSGRIQPTNKWCCNCSKCLFVFASLYPFVDTKQLVKIFGANLFEDKNLLQLMKELIGERKFKPFECIGTTKESLVAFYLSLQKTHPPLPILLKYFRKHIVKKHYTLPEDSKALLSTWNTQHALPPYLEKELKSVLR